MPTRRDIISDFWKRFAGARGAIGGEVSCYDLFEQTLGAWRERVRGELPHFLRAFRTDADGCADFARHLLGTPLDRLDDHRLKTALRWHAAQEFCSWLRSKGVPPGVASTARSVYEFHFVVVEPL
jgi:hypothetical protein